MKKQIKVAWFPSNTPKSTVLTSNGKSLDNYFKSLEVDEQNGTYTLDGTALSSSVDYMNTEDILKVQLDYGDEIFRISKVTTGTRYIDIVGRQIAIADSLGLYLEDVRPENMSGQGALSHLLTNAVGTKEITLSSDITNTNTAYYQDMNLYSALFDCDQSFVSRWGGEVQFRGYTISINNKIGADRGVSIREGKNLTGFNGTSNIDDLVTRARGKGNNGLFGNWIDSPIKASYTNVYSRTFEYQDVKVKGESDTDGFATEALAIAELDKRIKLEFSNNNVDKIKATYTLNYEQLERTNEYKNYVVSERSYKGDTLRVYIPKLKTDIKVRVVGRKYDILAQKVKEMTLSNTMATNVLSMNNIINDLKNQYSNTNNNSIASYIDMIIKAGMKDSYLIVRENELLIMDTKDINTAINVTRFNKNGLGFSHTGYYGHYDYGFTSDGKINASLIATGVLSTILITNADGSFQIDLSGKGGVSFFNNGKKAMEISKNKLRLYNWENDSDYIGSLGSLVYESENKASVPAIGLFHDKDSFLSIGAQDGDNDSSIETYMEFNKNDLFKNGSKAIIVFQTIEFENEVEIKNKLRVHAGITFNDNGSNLDTNSIGEIWGNNNICSEKSLYSDKSITTAGNLYCGEIYCNGLHVSNSNNKQRVIETSQGRVGINALETPKIMNMDVGRNKLNEDGECIIPIESLFAECIETDDYEITLTKYGKGDVWVQEMNLDSFLVCGTPNLNFSWTLIATQKGCKGIRLEKVNEEELEKFNNRKWVK